MEDIKQLDWDIMLFLNDWGNDTVDLIFNIITYKYYAIPLYAYLLYLLYKKLSRRELIIALLTIVVLVAASDQIAMLFKNTLVQRLRPFREPGLEGLISKVGKSGGTYGFYSGHASNAMALAVFLWHLLKKSHKTVAILLFVWAILVAYSRVYLGVHYPGDVLMGMFMGTIIGWLCFKLYGFLVLRFRESVVP
ncbi:MAG: phosphatase PAP2 family protein [Nonlabens sp.]|uniref:phosphatase PAP2 family protein n=1 Tax=Nonlabens sp. TaxID=1888209 RepID=UPI003EF23054